MMALRATMCMFLALTQVSNADDDVRELVARGLDHLQAGETELALAALLDASAARPDDPIITFDLGTAQLAAGQYEEAERSLAHAAALVEPDLALAVARNRALVAAQQAAAIGGESPEELRGPDRKHLVERALTAISHLRTVLEASRDDEDARHDMTVIKSWLIALRDEWRRRDEERRDEQQDQEEQPEGSLEILARLRDGQQELGEAMSVADPPPDLPGLASDERENVAPLIDEFRTAFARELEQARAQAAGGAGPTTRPGGDQEPDPLGEAEAAVGRATDTLAAGIESVAIALEGGDPRAARGSSDGVVDLADELWKGLAPFPAMLMRAHEEQKAIVDADDQAQAADERRTREHTLLMVEKARQMAEAQAAGAAPAAAGPGGAMQAPDDGMGEALEKAQELGPVAAERQETAAGLMELQKWEGARENTAEALRLIEEILASLPQDQQSQQSQQDQENQEQEDDQDSEQEEGQEQESAEEESQGEEQQETSEEEKEEQEGDLSEEQVQALLRRIREREAERRKEERERRGSGRIPVEKDW